MSATITIEIPREVLHAARMTTQDLRRELAVQLYRQGRLSFGKARELAGLTIWDFQSWLGSQGIPVHYDLPEYDEDVVQWGALKRP